LLRLCSLSALTACLDRIPYTRLSLQKKDNNRVLFHIEAMQQFPQRKFIFTDASKSSDAVGIGVYGPEGERTLSRVSPFFSICMAEILAIKKALNYIQDHPDHKFVIFSDSLSALEKISGAPSTKSDHVTLQVREIIHNLNERSNRVVLAWIPGHSEIARNEEADQLAKLGLTSDNLLEVDLPSTECLPIFKQELWDIWKDRWKTISCTKGKFYADLIEQPYKTPWFKDYKDLSRKNITTLIGMRSNHTLSASHLYRIGVVENPNCECGEISTLNHIFF